MEEAVGSIQSINFVEVGPGAYTSPHATEVGVGVDGRGKRPLFGIRKCQSDVQIHIVKRFL